jgi:phosphate transport system substrate-binding protein
MVFTGSVLTGCGEKFDASNDIVVVTRDTNSGTREAFTEKIFDGRKYGSVKLPDTAVSTESTMTVLAQVQMLPYAIAYESLGYCDESVKLLSVEGVAATAANVANGTYTLQRPFVICSAVATADLNDLAKDFWSFLQSKEAQDLVASNGYVKNFPDAAAFVKHTGDFTATTIYIRGSTSVNPVMLKLIAKYKTFYAQALTFNVSATGSGDGANVAKNNFSAGALAGCAPENTLGMLSREIADSEKTAATAHFDLAKDGVGIIVNKLNPLTNITIAQIRNIYGVSWSPDTNKTSTDVSGFVTNNSKVTKWNEIITV